jgi:hypothetical protein
MSSILESSARPVDFQNQPRKLPDGSTYELTDEEQKIQQMVLDKYKEAKKHRRTYDKDWERWYRLYSGQQWDGPRPDWKSTPVVNFIFSTIETIVPIMTDSNPQVVVAPSLPSCAQTAEVFNDLVKRVWVNNDMDLKLPAIVRNSLKYGTGFAKVWWKEPEVPSELGDVAISVVDPRHIFPSPGAVDMNDAAWVIFAANVPIHYVEGMYPQAKGRLVGGIWDEDLTVHKTITSQTGTVSASVVGPVQSATGGDGSGSSASSSWPTQDSYGRPVTDRSKLVTLCELWHKVDGRMQLTVAANGLVLRNGESPFNHNRYPFVKFVDYDIPSNFWGMGEIQQLDRLQDFINKRRGQTQDILKICGNPPLVADANSGINPKAMTTRPGSIIYKNPGTDVHWLTPPQLPSALFEIQALDKQDFDGVSGIYDVTQGRKPKGIEAAAAIGELQEAAQTRLRLKVRNLEGSLRQLGQLVVDMIQQFYDEPRVVRIVGGDPSQPDFVLINQQIVDSTGKAITINDVSTGKYDIEIGVGSTMPVNKTKLYNEMKEMYQLQIVDAQAVLENSSLSPAQVSKILSRQAQAQQAAMAQQGMAPPPSGGSGSGGPDPHQMRQELHQLTQGQ